MTVKEWILCVCAMLALFGGATSFVWLIMDMRESDRRFMAALNCRSAYEGAARERCIHRVVNGGPIYEENINLMRKGK